MTRDVFVLGADDFNMAQLASVRLASRCRFHVLASHHQIKAGPEYPVADTLARARRTLAGFEGGADALIGWWDFPVSTMLPILRREFGLPGPTLESVLACEHKYWSRIEQRACVPECIPRFAAFDPFDPDALRAIGLAFPFWVKPVKSAASYLAYRVRDSAEFEAAQAAIRRGIDRLAVPFDHILAHAHLPQQVEGIGGRFCLAEEVISSGRQCTLEGYVHRGETVVYGVVDSIRSGGARSSFSRYQYPSSLPGRVRLRMAEVVRRFLAHVGFDGGPFNAEFFWNPKEDRLRLLEVNTRISKSHCPLFKLVDGEYHHAVNLALGLGERPEFPHRQGRHRIAAKFMLRRFRDARVLRVPDEAELQGLRERFPDAQIQLHVSEGMRLSDLRDQDSYSYEVAVVYLGAASQAELLRDYDCLVRAMDLRFDDEDGRGGT